jgi:hypothetical protein
MRRKIINEYIIGLIIEKASKHKNISFARGSSPSINQISECFDVLFLLYHMQKYKTRSLLSQYETTEKKTNVQASGTILAILVGYNDSILILLLS